MNTLQIQYMKQIKEMVSVCHRLADDKYVTSHGGNISWKMRNVILITPTKKCKEEICFKDICIVDNKGKTLYAPEGGKPTGELPFHLMIYEKRDDIASIIHAHPPVTTSFSISKAPYLGLPILPETITEIGPVCMVPYAEPLTDTLADNFRKYLRKYNAFLMENHGFTMISRYNIERTRQLVDLVECSAISIAKAFQMNAVNTLPYDAIENLEKVMKKRNLPLPGKQGAWENLNECYSGR